MKIIKGGMTLKFLIVEDELHLNNILHDYVKESFPNDGIDQAFSGESALEYFGENQYDFVLLDVMLPGINGFDVCKKIKSTSATPVIMLSALTDEENQIKGYNLGIDEFVKKPYSPKLVIKKIEAVLSRYHKLENQDFSTYGIIQYDLHTQKIQVENENIILNKKEWDLFNMFINNIGIVLTRESLLNKVWGYDYFGDERTLDTHIKRLRQKLLSASSYVKTVFKTGYKFEK